MLPLFNLSGKYIVKTLDAGNAHACLSPRSLLFICRYVKDHVFPAGLASIHCLVSQFEKLQFGTCIFRVTGTAKTGGKFYVKTFTLNEDMTLNGAADTFSNYGSPVYSGLDEYYRIFIPPVTDYRIHVTHRFFQQQPHFGQGLASHKVSVLIVYSLEEIYVKKDDGYVGRITLGAPDFPFEGYIKVTVIEEPSQFVDVEKILGTVVTGRIFQGKGCLIKQEIYVFEIQLGRKHALRFVENDYDAKKCCFCPDEEQHCFGNGVFCKEPGPLLEIIKQDKTSIILFANIENIEYELPKGRSGFLVEPFYLF